MFGWFFIKAALRFQIVGIFKATCVWWKQLCIKF